MLKYHKNCWWSSLRSIFDEDREDCGTIICDCICLCVHHINNLQI